MDAQKKEKHQTVSADHIMKAVSMESICTLIYSETSFLAMHDAISAEDRTEPLYSG